MYVLCATWLVLVISKYTRYIIWWSKLFIGNIVIQLPVVNLQHPVSTHGKQYSSVTIYRNRWVLFISCRNNGEVEIMYIYLYAMWRILLHGWLYLYEIVDGSVLLMFGYLSVNHWPVSLSLNVYGMTPPFHFCTPELEVPSHQNQTKNVLSGSQNSQVYKLNSWNIWWYNIKIFICACLQVYEFITQLLVAICWEHNHLWLNNSYNVFLDL